jgi:hypothetical protein
VRGGYDWKLEPHRETGVATHTLPNVYGEMMLQVCSDYPNAPPARTMTLSEIRFFYEGLRAGLRKTTKPK